MNQTQTPWQDFSLPEFGKVEANCRFDVVVVGGGITGLTAAYLLKKARKKVCVLERGQICHGDTGCTTAHLTYVTDTRLSKLVDDFGEETARAVWQGGAAAINTIEQIASTEGIDCEFQRVPGFLHASFASDKDESKELMTDAEIAHKLGFAASYMPLVPHIHKQGVGFANQAKFHPLKYLAGLAKAIHGNGSAIFENSDASEFESEPHAVKVNGKRIKYKQLVIATHVPAVGEAGFLNMTLVHSKMAPYSSYAIGAEIPLGTLPEACFWDTTNPYYYLRVDRQRDRDYAIFGGKDHKTGQADDIEARFRQLEELLSRIIPGTKVDCHWSGQVIEPHDGLPFIGQMAERQFISTGYSGNGMTSGTLGAMMACDWVLGRDNPWKDVFDVSRKPITRGAWDYITSNFDYPYYLVRDRLRKPKAKSTRSVRRGHGMILEVNGERAACSRDDDGTLHCVSAICTHMGCVVHWNGAERTWDCPCHGSRFRANGEVMAGPAKSPLEPIKKSRTAKKEKAAASAEADADFVAAPGIRRLVE